MTNRLFPAPPILWQGSPNFWAGRNGFNPEAICDHIMEGTMESTDGWFKNYKSQASVQFGVAKNGRIWQWVRVQDSAWGNGILQSPDTSVPLLADCLRRDINPNYRTISIEHEGMTGDPFPEAQYAATLALHMYLCSVYNIPIDRNHIIGHYQVMSRDRANCPGPTFPWKRLMADLERAFMNDNGTINPKNYDIGDGFKEVLTIHHLTAAGPETYLNTGDGLPTSILLTNEGPVLIGQKKFEADQWNVRILAGTVI